jgi:hypothetical protein
MAALRFAEKLLSSLKQASGESMSESSSGMHGVDEVAVNLTYEAAT